MPKKRWAYIAKPSRLVARKCATEADRKELEAGEKEEQYWREAEVTKSKAAARCAEARRQADIEEEEIDKAMKKVRNRIRRRTALRFRWRRWRKWSWGRGGSRSKQRWRRKRRRSRRGRVERRPKKSMKGWCRCRTRIGMTWWLKREEHRRQLRICWWPRTFPPIATLRAG